MKRKKITDLLAVELDADALAQLVGGTSGRPIGNNFPHDLITPAAGTKPYTVDDPDADK